jgi:ATP-dependent Clp protease protease subunit
MKIALSALLAFSTILGGGYLFKSLNATPQKETVVTLPSGVTPTKLEVTTNQLVQPKRVVKHTASKDRVLYLVDQVQFNSVQPLVNRIKELNAKSKDPIYLLIDSPGGSVIDGASLISEMEASAAPVYTVCTRLCASMAAMIHSYGTKRLALDRAILMYHPASGGASGQVRNMLSQITAVNSLIEKMVANVTGRSKITPEEFQRLVAYEIWIDAEDATIKGHNDEIVNLNVPSYLPQNVTFELTPPDGKAKRLRTFDPQMIAPDSILHMWSR